MTLFGWTTRSADGRAPLRLGAEVRRLPRARRGVLTGSADVLIVRAADTLALSAERKWRATGACHVLASNELEAEAAATDLTAAGLDEYV